MIIFEQKNFLEFIYQFEKNYLLFFLAWIVFNCFRFWSRLSSKTSKSKLIVVAYQSKLKNTKRKCRAVVSIVAIKYKPSLEEKHFGM